IKKVYPDVAWLSWLPFVTQFMAVASLLALSPASTYFTESVSGTDFLKFSLFLPILIALAATISKQNGWMAAMLCFGGLIYIMLPAVMLMQMRMQSLLTPLSLILMIWTNDTMAYIVGSLIGKTPFSEI